MNEGHYPETPGYAKHSDTSFEAAQLIDAKTIRQAMLRMVTAAGEHGMTADEAVYKTGRLHQTISPRFTELSKLGEIVDSGQRRLTKAGRRAVVWVVAPMQMSLV